MSGNGGNGQQSSSASVVLDRRQAFTINRSLGASLKSPLVKSTWQPTNAPEASSRTDDIWFEDVNTGWLVNSSGFVCHTTDGGDSWTPQYFVPPSLAASPYLRTIEFAPGGHTGWFGALVSGNTAYLDILLHKTTDGGKTWAPVTNLPSNTPPGICGISVVDENTVFGAGTNDPNVNQNGSHRSTTGTGVIYTYDGGDDWGYIDMSEYADNLIDIHFFDGGYGYVVGGKNDPNAPSYLPGYDDYPQYTQLKPVVLRTTDGGRSWTNVIAHLDDELPTGGWGWKIFPLSLTDIHSDLFISIEKFTEAWILKGLYNSGAHDRDWTLHRVNDSRLYSGSLVSNGDLEGIGFIDRNTGWVGGWGNVDFYGHFNSFTTDGGENWSAQDNVPGAALSDVRVNVNRYRFFNQPGGTLIGYCSGKSEYKLIHHAGDPLTEEIQGGSLAEAKNGAKGGAVALATHELKSRDKGGATASLSTPQLDLKCTPVGEEGEVEISYRVPEGTQSTYVGVWSHFGWHVRTLVEESEPEPGVHTCVWDGKDAEGKQLHGDTHVRLACDQAGESESVRFAYV